MDCVYAVGNELGPGFLVGVYEKALCLELTERGKYFADILVQERLLLEVKAVSNLVPEHKAQVINWLNLNPRIQVEGNGLERFAAD